MKRRARLSIGNQIRGTSAASGTCNGSPFIAGKTWKSWLGGSDSDANMQIQSLSPANQTKQIKDVTWQNPATLQNQRRPQEKRGMKDTPLTLPKTNFIMPMGAERLERWSGMQ